MKKSKYIAIISTAIICEALFVRFNTNDLQTEASIYINEVTETESPMLRTANIKTEINKETEVKVLTETESEIDIYEVAFSEMDCHMRQLETTENKQQWFVEYKEIIDKYSDVIDPPETIYDCYSEDVLNKLFGVVAAEVGDEYSFEAKCNAASVIFNRIEADGFEDTLNKVLSPGQFTTIKNGTYKTKEVTDKTILACEYAFMIGDTTDGALYFESHTSDVHDSYAKFMFKDDAHKFYK